ncbi:MAG: D-2-hydroxyacid dehydrogenase [Phycisphaerae bacterium]|nr:D-2-hydroxyacid dehydrogenase [Phycisphaerae bacterium]
MNIVVLDGHALNPGDLSWHPLEALGRCVVYDRTPAEQTVARAADAEIVITNKTRLDADVLARLPKLRYIGVLATGYNVVDIAAAKRRDIVVANVPAYSTASVAQTVFAHLLNLTHHVAEHAAGVREGKWAACEDFCYWDVPLIELAGQTMGIVGYGRIGRAVARCGAAFGMDVLACDPHAEIVAPAEPADLGALLRAADVVTLHCPLTDETRGLIDSTRLALMKPTAFLINASRGPVIDEAALADALNAGRIAGAGLDVLCAEPPASDNPLAAARNCYITPHIAWATRAARQRLMTIAIDNVRAFLAARPKNVIA